MKLSIIGFGRVSSAVLENILTEPLINKYVSSINIVTRTSSRVDGFLIDLMSSFYDAELPKVYSSSCSSSIEESDIIIISGDRVDYKLRHQASSSEAIGCSRISHSILNYDFICSTAEAIKAYCPNAIVFVLTNQVDINCEILRRRSGSSMILGVGNMLDTYRYRYLLNNLLLAKGIKNHHSSREAQIFCYHNNNMLLLESSIQKSEDDQLQTTLHSIYNEALCQTINFGKFVSNLQRTELSVTATGAVIGPSKVMKDALLAYLGIDPPIVFSFNTCLNFNPYLKSNLQDSLDIGFGYPIEINRGQILPSLYFRISDKEFSEINKARIDLNTHLERILSHV